MKLYAPGYYKKFKCIADKCENSCCIGWEIDVDDCALKKYKNLQNGYGADIINSISMDGTPHVKLAAGDGRYFTIFARKLFHIRRKPNISLEKISDL